MDDTPQKTWCAEYNRERERKKEMREILLGVSVVVKKRKRERKDDEPKFFEK